MDDVDYLGPYTGLYVVAWLAAMVVVWIMIAVGNGFLARQLGKSVVLWVILSLIPIVNSFFYIYVAYAVVLGLLRRLNAIAAKLNGLPA